MRLTRGYFKNDALHLAPDILGKTLLRRFEDGVVFKSVITEVEIYRGEEDLACHASKGKTERTRVMYSPGGFIYVYLIYGMYWMLNIVTGENGHPQALLIRSLYDVPGPGRVGRKLKLDKSFYGEDLEKSRRIWIEDLTGEGAILSKDRSHIFSSNKKGTNHQPEDPEHSFSENKYDLKIENKIIEVSKRVGVGYAGKWADMLWRYSLKI